MFPIYGCAALLTPIFRFMRKKPLIVRGLTYMSVIFSMEFFCGMLLRRKSLCPWDYSRERLNVQGLIRLDYAPLWMGAGLLFERVLGCK